MPITPIGTATTLKLTARDSCLVLNDSVYFFITGTPRCTFRLEITESNLDLVFSTCNLADKIVTEVHDDNLVSDHFPVSIKLNIDKTIYRRRNLNLKSKKNELFKVKEGT